MRSCPPGMQGTLMMLVEVGNLISTRGGDIVGVGIYRLSPTNGFVYRVTAITVVYASMLPVTLLIPRHLPRTTDGQADPEAEREVAEEIARLELSRRSCPLVTGAERQELTPASANA